MEARERVEFAKLHQTIAKQNLQKAKKQTFGRKAAVAQYQADLDALVEKEKARIEARKAEQIAEGERVRARWKAKPYQLWSRANWATAHGVSMAAAARPSKRLRQWNIPPRARPSSGEGGNPLEMRRRALSLQP